MLFENLRVRGGTQNIPHWYRHLYSSCGSAKRRSKQTKLWIPSSTAMFCGDCLKTCEDVAPNFAENRPGCFTMTTPRLTLPSSTNSFWRNKKMAVIPHPLYFPDLTPCDLFIIFPKTKLKVKWRRFDTIEEIQAESPRVFDTLTEKDFQEAFQKWRRLWNSCLHAGENYFEGDGGR
jgi:hypothetical protein